jgi:3-hydroxyacyl-CoA dehydrogenase/enoyl-CoA hydratase/3-hydroxybutyryl-CoA epimerase
MNTQAFNLIIDQEGIARIVFDLPDSKVNVLSQAVLDDFDHTLEELKNDKRVKALLITSTKPGIFIAGADIKSFIGVIDDPKLVRPFLEKSHSIFSKLENLPFPSIAVINGVCLGGGTELALSCTYRIVTDNPATSIGLPEVNLGIFPAWGGSQRLPKLVGFKEGIQMIITGKPINAMKAYKIKFADAIISTAFVEEKVNEFIQDVLTAKGRQKVLQRRKRTGVVNFLMEGNSLGRSLIYNLAKKGVLKETKGNYPAPLIALDLVNKTYTSSLKDGLKEEINTLVDNTNTGLRTAPNLIKIFFNNEALKSNPGGPADVKAKKIDFAGVIGAGTMGSGITWLFSNAGIPVRMKDINWEAVGKGYGSASEIYKTLIRIKKLKPNEARLKFLNIGGTVDYSGFNRSDIVIEAATENVELKHKILTELEKEVSPECIIATNTSSLSVKSLAAVLSKPERMVGMHFFNPPNRMPLVEIIQGEQTSPLAVATAIDLCKRLKKTPVVVKDCAGFLINRILISGMGEAIKMLEEGVPMSEIEKVVLDFGMPMGPFTLSDEVGNDVGQKIGVILEDAYPDRMMASSLVNKMCEMKFYGKKVGKGFFIYGKNSKEINPEVSKLIQVTNERKLTTDQICDRFILCMINEASRCLEEKVVQSASVLDMAMVLGTGFPPFRGGLLNYADEVGIHNVVEKLQALEKSEGGRFKPSNLLIQMDKDNRKFYD